MRHAAMPAPEFKPLWQMNTTPLIDVLLVLLIMFILTIPAQTHKVSVDLPVAGPGVPRETYRLRIDTSGALRWDGRAIADAELDGHLATVAAHPNAILQLEAAAEFRYGRFDAVLAQIKGAGVTGWALSAIIDSADTKRAADPQGRRLQSSQLT